MKEKFYFKILLLAVAFSVFYAPHPVLAKSVPSENSVRSESSAYRQGEIIIKTSGILSQDIKLLKKYRLSLLRRDRSLGYILASAAPQADIREIAASLRQEETVLYAQPNFIYRPLGVPNDPLLSRQLALQNIGFLKAWDAIKPLKSSKGVILAILDTGIDVNHPDLKSRLTAGTNTINPLKSVRDSDGHGTHVAGIAAASINNGVGISGIAGIDAIKIMPVKVFEGDSGNDITISDGIIWAADHGARVMNMSFGSFSKSFILDEAISYAARKGVVMVAAAGNWASQEISYPAAISRVIAVSAIDNKNNLTDFSSFGPLIDVCAPGEEVYSTYWDKYKGSTYTEMSGTSMASPAVAGLAALLLAKDPKLTNEDVRQIIEASADDLGDTGWDPKYGHGRINVLKTLAFSLAKLEDNNNTMNKAIPLKVGQVYKETIDFGSDVDWYKVSIPRSGSLQIEVLPAGKVSPGVEIYNTKGKKISDFNTGSQEQGKGPEGDAREVLNSEASGKGLKVAEAVYGLMPNLREGMYYIKVFGNHFRWSDETYSLTAKVFEATELVKDLNETNNTYQQARNLDLGRTSTGAIMESGDQDWFRIRFTGRAYKIHVDVPQGLDLAVEIQSAANFRQSTSEESYKTYLENWFFQNVNNEGIGINEDGIIILPDNQQRDYYIKVYETSGGSINGNYKLTVSQTALGRDRYETNDNRGQAAPIPLTGIEGNIYPERDEDWYQVEVIGIGVLKIDLQHPQSGWCSLNLYREGERDPLATYYGHKDSRSEGYGSIFDEGNDISLDSRKQSFEYKVFSGKYYINIKNLDNSITDNYNFAAQFISFNFIDQEINDTPTQAVLVNIGDSLQGTLNPKWDADFYTLNVTKPQPVLITLAPPADIDTLMVVMREVENDPKPDKEVTNEPVLEQVTLIDSGGKGKIDSGVLTISKAGKYYLMVVAAEGKSQGQYKLTIKPFKILPDTWENNNHLAQAKPVASGVSIHPTFMGTEDSDWYKIYVKGPGKLTVKLSVPNDIDGVLEFYNGTGQLLTRLDQSMVGEEESGVLTVSKPGYYYIKTYDYLGNSSVQTYSLSTIYTPNVPLKHRLKK